MLTNCVDNYNGTIDTSHNAAEILHVMGNAHRLKILQLISEKEVPVSEIVKTVGLSQSATSQHLQKMCATRIVQRRRDSQTIYYKLASEPVRQILKCIGAEEIVAAETSH